MSKQYPGGFITKNFTAPTTSSAPGMWTLDQALYYTQQGVWPIPTPIDQYFNYVSLLLHGNGSASGTSNVLPFNSDASTNNFNLTINGDARPNNFTPYQGNGYYSNLFNGSTDYLTVPLAAYDFGTGAFTCEAWVYIRSVATTNMIFYGSVSGGALDELAVAVNTSQQLGWETNNSISNSGGFIPLNTWTHIALVRNGSTVTGYVNGSSVGTTTDSGAVTPTTHSLIGSYRGTILFTNGYISNARVTKSAVYTSNFTPSTTPLAAITNTSLLTCQSNRFIDNSTNAYTITPSGTAAVSPAQPFTLSSSVATYGSGYFDGTGDNLTTASNTAFAFGTGDFTIEFWAYKTANTPGSYDIAFGTGDAGTGNNGYFIELSSTRGFVFASNNSVVLSYAMNPNTSAWAHYAVTRSGSTLRLFVNGAVVTSTTYSTSLTSTVAVRVGGTGNDFFGYLVDMRVVKGTAVYTTTYTLPTAPLTAISGTSLLTTQYNGAGNNNGFKDSSQNNFVVSRFGNTTQGTFTPYGSNWSNYFNGASYFTSSTSQIIPTGSFTVECLVYVTSTANQAFVAQGTSGNAGRFSLCIESGLWFAQIGSASINTGTPVANTWNYLAVTFNGSTLTLYVNGTSIGTASTGTSAQNTTLAIGTLGASWATTGYFVTGYISNVRVSSVVRTIATPTAPYTSDASTKLLACQSNRFIDSSSNAYVLNLSAGAPSVQRFSPFAPTSAYSTSTIGGSGYFDGTGDYLTGTSPNLSGTWTVELWWYPTALSGNQTIISFNNGAGPGINIWSNSSGQLSVDDGNTGQAAFTTTTFKANQWNHLAVVRNSTTTTGYINGVVAGSNSFTPSTTSAFSIGRFNGGSFQYSNGYISNVRVVNGTAIYTSAFTPPTAPVVATSNTSLLCNMTNAAIYDNAMMSDQETVGNAMVSTSVKKFGNASMYFDGTGDGLQVVGSPNTAFGTGDFTVEFWIYLNASTGSFKKFVELGTSGACFTIETQSTTNVLTITDLNTTVFVTSSSALSLTTWTHVAATRSGTTLRLFQNGTQVGSATNSTNFANSGNVYIGQSNSGQAINAYMDDLRITKGVARYTANFTPPTSQLPDQ